MFGLAKRLLYLSCLVLLAAPALPLAAAQSSAAPLQDINQLGRGTAKLEGPWQFHLGDNPAWALPQTGDSAGDVGWEQLSPDKTWGEQGHPSYVGYAWYRKHIHITPAEGASPDFALYIGHIDDVYQIYWNGLLVGHYGAMPPHYSYPYIAPPQTFGLGPIRDGVLAIRVWKGPLMSFDSANLGGLHAAPILGSPTAIAGLKSQSDYNWLRNRQYYFGLQALYFLVMLLSLLTWFRNRSHRVLMWMAIFSGAQVLVTFLVGLRIPFSMQFSLGWMQPLLSLIDISLWFLLLYLLDLDENPTLSHFTRLLATVSICSSSLDGLMLMLNWSNPALAPWLQGLDAVFTTFFTVAEAYPLVLVALAVRKRLDHARWLVAIAAFLAEMISVLRIALEQGSRYTHWTIGDKIGQPLFTINGNNFTAGTIASSLLLLAIIYGVYRYLKEAGQRQASLEAELKSARELQQVLIPEQLPPLPGFAFTSSYRPAQEVGGDFFQVIPLEGENAGSTLILLGDVSGKGLKAAMTVSLIVGAVRTLAKFAPQPAAILSELNQRLCGRMQGGFVTCLALRLGADGECVVASAGHPAPFLNKREVSLPGAIPLGVLPATLYEEAVLTLHEGDHFALYTDGLLEARRPGGEIFSFDRLDALFATRPDAARAAEAAINFGQDDDITVLTLTRLATGQQSTTTVSIPRFASS